MKHTPGPWRVYKGRVHPSFDGPSPQTTNADHAICEPFGPDAPFNARLIAAAPDMKAAIEGFLDQLSVYDQCDANGRICTFCTVCHVDEKQGHESWCDVPKMEAALAKAKGETQ